MLLTVALLGLTSAVYIMQALGSERQAFSKVSPWFTSAPTSSAWTPLRATDMLDVHAPVRTDAVELLRDREFIALSQEGLALLAPEAPRPPGGQLPYLLRSLQLSRYLHEPQAYVSPAGDVWLRVEAVSRWPLPMQERPLILLLETPPKRVYVDAVVHHSRD